ncbi:hypothetical protein Tco_0277108 [Tanacetum coccineum]
MYEKAKDPKVINKNISHKPFDYEKLNRLSDDFGKRFTPQQELSAEQAFWLRMSNPTSKPSDASPVNIESPKELPKVNLLNESLKKLKFHLAMFDNVVKIRTTPDAHVLLTVMNSMSLLGESVNMDGKRKESCNLEAELLKSQNTFNDLLKRYSQLEKHCISLEASIHLNQEIFQKDESCNNQNALEIPEFFENNDLKAQLQDKDSTICKLKDMIKLMREKSKEENVEYDYGEIETKNVELENSVAKLISENERLCNEINHVKQHYCSRHVQARFRTFSSQVIANKEIHIEYLKYTQKQADILQGIVEQAKAKQPLDKELDFACKHAQRIQELLVYAQDTCPNAIKLNEKKVDVTPKNKVKKVKFTEPLASSSKIKQVESSTTSDSNTHVLSPTGLKCSTSNCRSTPTGNKKNDRISRTTSRNMKNKKALDDVLVTPADCLEFEKCNMRLKTDIKPKEGIFQVVLDALALTPFYQAFLITTEICPKIPGQEFEDLLLEQEVLSSIKDLGHTGDVTYLTDVNVDFLHQPWRVFATVINKCLSGKETGIDKIRLSHAQILWDSQRHEDTKVYGTLLPKHLTNQAMLESKAYQTYYAFASGEKAPKPKYIRKKVDSNTSNKKKPVQATKAKQLKLATKRSKKDFHMSHASGSGDGVDIQSKVLDEQQQKTSSTDEGTGTIPAVLNVPTYKSESEKESWGDSEDEDDNDGDNDDDGDSDDHKDDSDDERTKSDRDEIPDPKLTNVDQTEHEEEEYDDEFYEEEEEEEENIDDEETMYDDEDD